MTCFPKPHPGSLCLAVNNSGQCVMDSMTYCFILLLFLENVGNQKAICICIILLFSVMVQQSNEINVCVNQIKVWTLISVAISVHFFLLSTACYCLHPARLQGLLRLSRCAGEFFNLSKKFEAGANTTSTKNTCYISIQSKNKHFSILLIFMENEDYIYILRSDWGCFDYISLHVLPT